MSGVLRILILEDRETDAELMEYELRTLGMPYEARRVWTEPDFVDEVRTRTPDLILADYTLPAYDGMRALGFVAAEHPDVPFIFVSGSLGEETAIDALHHGAIDYVLKHRLTRLGPAVRRALAEVDERRRRVESERRRCEAEAALRVSEERFKSIFDHVTDGILLVDPTTGAFVDANRTMCSMLGCSREEVLALGLERVSECGRIPEIEAAFRRDQPGDAVVIHDLAVTRKDRTAFYADINSAPVLIQDRRLVMMNVRDVTERRALQASVVQADRLASMGMLAAGVAHEINNPLAYVLCNIENLAEDLSRLGPTGAVSDDLVGAAKEALAGTLRIRDITQGLSTFSRVDRVECASVDVNYVIECAASLAQNEIKYRARLVKELGTIPVVWASEGRLCQVFLNLLINAAHAIPEGHPDLHTITLRTLALDGHVVAEVADTGTGISPENLTRMFEPFFTTKPPGVGSGLGLAISRSIVEGLGGSIHVESAVGSGTRFFVRVPVPVEGSAVLHPAARPEASGGAVVRGRVLAVDDEDAIRRVLQRALGHQHDVVTAASGAEARTLIEQGGTFDVILCDLMMDDMTGMELHEWLVARDPGLAARVVFLTGGAFTDAAKAFLASVPNVRLEKPIETAALRQVAMDGVRKHRQSGRTEGL